MDANDNDIFQSAASTVIPKDFDPNTAENNEDIEKQFAVVCIEQAEAYWKLITRIKASTLPKLTKWDDAIVDKFIEIFPEIATDKARLAKIDEQRDLKSAVAKPKWRKFASAFEKTVEDYNFGTLIRADAADDYTEANSIFGYRVQFFAIEIQRNRLGLNDVNFGKQ